MKHPHHAGTYAANARKVRDAAKANHNTVCWRDGLPLDQHEPHHDGTPAYWTAGHTQDGDATATPWTNPTQQPPAGSWLAPEASTCNYSHGATQTNQLRNNPHSRPWLRR
jgi:hypothetical protein